jgi:hypothetical protein
MTDDTTANREWRFDTVQRADLFIAYAQSIGMIVNRCKDDPHIVEMRMAYGIMGDDLPVMIARAFNAGFLSYLETL